MEISKKRLKCESGSSSFLENISITDNDIDAPITESMLLAAIPEEEKLKARDVILKTRKRKRDEFQALSWPQRQARYMFGTIVRCIDKIPRVREYWMVCAALVGNLLLPNEEDKTSESDLWKKAVLNAKFSVTWHKEVSRDGTISITLDGEDDDDARVDVIIDSDSVENFSVPRDILPLPKEPDADESGWEFDDGDHHSIGYGLQMSSSVYLIDARLVTKIIRETCDNADDLLAEFLTKTNRHFECGCSPADHAPHPHNPDDPDEFYEHHNRDYKDAWFMAFDEASSLNSDAGESFMAEFESENHDRICCTKRHQVSQENSSAT